MSCYGCDGFAAMQARPVMLATLVVLGCGIPLAFRFFHPFGTLADNGTVRYSQAAPRRARRRRQGGGWSTFHLLRAPSAAGAVRRRRGLPRARRAGLDRRAFPAACRLPPAATTPPAR